MVLGGHGMPTDLRVATVAAQAGSTMLPAALRLTERLRNLPLVGEWVHYGGKMLYAGRDFIGNSWQKQALMEYLGQVHARYLQHSLGQAIKHSADDVMTVGGKSTLGEANPFLRQITLAGKARLSTLAHELIHFEQLMARGLWGLPNTAANRALLASQKNALEEAVEKVLTLWKFAPKP